MELFPELFKSNKLTEETGENLAITEVSAPDWARQEEEKEEKEKESVAPAPTPSTARQTLTSFTGLEADKLDYQAIHEELSGHSVRAKVLLMQALRWVKLSK